MPQTIFADIDPNTTSGNQLATYLNDFKAALLSSLSGTARPTELEAGGTWLDIAADPIWYLKLFDGTDDIVIMTVDTTSNSASLATALNLFTISKTSADTASPVLEMIKARIANLGQVLGGDYVGTWQVKGNDNAGGVPVVVRVRAQATQNFTSSTAGTDLIFEATPTGSAAIAEWMRLSNGKLGIGTQAPSNTLHAVGSGIRSERSADDTTPAKFIARKKKATGTGQTLNTETFAVHELNSTDEVGTEVLAAKIEAVATEDHTSTAQGTKVVISTKNIGSTAFTEKISIGETVEVSPEVNLAKGLKVTETLKMLEQVDSSTTGSGQSLSPTKSVLKVTNASLVSINNIANPADGKFLGLINGTGALVTILNDVGGTAANRIKTGTGADLTLDPGASIILIYDNDASRWQVFGGSGGAGGGGGGSLQWIEQGNSPTPNVENFVQNYLFASGLGQELYALVKVSEYYSPGRQIKMVGSFYSPDSSGTALLQTVATLIRPATDAITSTTNQRTSTNSAVTLGAGTVDKPQKVTFDLTDASGQINSVAVSKGDLIIVKLTRGTDTATSDLRALVYGAEVTLT